MAVGARFFFWWLRRGAGGSFVAPAPVGPADPTHDLLYGDGNGITWGADTIIDWPVI